MLFLLLLSDILHRSQTKHNHVRCLTDRHFSNAPWVVILYKSADVSSDLALINPMCVFVCSKHQLTTSLFSDSADVVILHILQLRLPTAIMAAVPELLTSCCMQPQGSHNGTFLTSSTLGLPTLPELLTSCCMQPQRSHAGVQLTSSTLTLPSVS